MFPASQLGSKHRPLGRMVQSEPEPTFPETKAASMAETDSVIGGNSTVTMTRTRTSTMIALRGQTVLSRKPRELLVGAAFDSRADNRGRWTNDLSDHILSINPMLLRSSLLHMYSTVARVLMIFHVTFSSFPYFNESVSVHHESCSHISS